MMVFLNLKSAVFGQLQIKHFKNLGIWNHQESSHISALSNDS